MTFEIILSENFGEFGEFGEALVTLVTWRQPKFSERMISKVVIFAKL